MVAPLPMLLDVRLLLVWLIDRPLIIEMLHLQVVHGGRKVGSLVSVLLQSYQGNTVRLHAASAIHSD
jgi:hypothetical protein